MLEIVQVPVLSDNYIYLAHDQALGQTAIIDPACETEVIAALDERGWTPTHILNTHHHWDHVGANKILKKRYGLEVIGFEGDAERLPGLDRRVKAGDTVQIGASSAEVIPVPGHTSGHIAYYFAGSSAAFVGDTLFSMGCGRLFEGTPAQMWDSLQKLRALPDETHIYCAHEYTETNGTFALTQEPDNSALKARMTDVKALRRAGKPTIPTTIGLEKATNPFLRADTKELQRALGLSDPVELFASVRASRDQF